MIDRSVRAAIKNRWMVVFFAAILGGVGIYCVSRMNIDAYPDISGVEVSLTTTYAGRAAEEVEQQVTIPLERAMAGVAHAETIRSRTIFGLSLVQIAFEPDVDDYWARQVVFERIGSAGLPPDAQVEMEPMDDAYGEVYAYELVGNKDYGPMELRELNDWVITPRLLKAKGVVDVENFGGLGKQYAVQVNPEKLLQYGVKLQDVKAAIQANNSSGGGSLLERGSTSLVVRGLGQVKDYRELENIFIKNSGGTQVFIRDIGKVLKDHLPQTGIFGKDDHNDSDAGIVMMRKGENPSKVLEAINDAVKELNQEKLPKGVQIVPFYDRTQLIHNTIRTVLENTFEGILLVVLTLFIFLGNPRIALIVAAAIPGSLVFALILMKLTGIPISLLSIGSIDFGVIVDGAIIVSENVIRHLTERKRSASVDETILAASEQVRKPMLFSMLIVIIAYLPLLSLQYIEGQLFRPMAITLCFALLGALLIALYVVPVLSSFLFKEDSKVSERDMFHWVNVRYAALLPKVLSHKKSVIGALSAVFLAVIFLVMPKLGIEFLPYMDEGVFWIRANFPSGISLQENAKYATEIRKLLHTFPEVDFVTSQTGRNDSGTDPFPTSRIEMMVGLKDRSQWKSHETKLELEASIQKVLAENYPTIHLNLTQPIIDSVTEDTNGTSADLAVDLVGPDLSILRQYAEKTVTLLKEVPGNVNVSIEQEAPQPQLQIRIDKAKLSHYQLSVDTINDVINTAVGGLPVSQLFEGERRFDILTKYAPNFVNTPEAISLLPAFNDQGEPIPLAQIATINVKDGQTLIAREGGERRTTVRADIRKRAQGDFVADAQERFAKQIELPEGYHVEWMGMFENLSRARAHFGLLIPLTIGIIFMLLFVTFGSLTQAATVLLTVPFALVGSILALWFRGMHLSVSAGVGLTSLFGVAVMHGVIMISYIEELRKSGMDLNSAILKGATLRLRPVLMTASVAILGLIPASLATGIGSDVQRPIATVVVWGLASSVLLTLFVLPAIYSALEGRRN